MVGDMTPPETAMTVPSEFISERVPGPLQLIETALAQGISVEGLERLLGMHERLKADAAREAYFDAVTGFQSECPVIPKTKTVRGSYSYSYAPLDVIVATVSPLLAKHGLSYRFDTRFEESPPAQVVTCVVTHRQGHSEQSEFRAPVDTGARMNTMQQSASSLTYAKRYAFCNALGILTGDEDDDSRSSSAQSPRVNTTRQPTPGGRPGEPTAPRAIQPRNAVRIAHSSPGAQGSDQGSTPSTPSFTPSPAETPAPSDSGEEVLAFIQLRQEAWDRAIAIETLERESRGQDIPVREVIEPIARGRCEAWLHRTYGERFDTATQPQFQALVRALDRRLGEFDTAVEESNATEEVYQ